MFRALVFVFAAPWWVFVILAPAFYAAALTNLDRLEGIKAAKEHALTQPPPEPVDLADFDKRLHVSPTIDEVHVTGVFNFDYNYHLVRRKDGKVDSERYLYMMFDADDGAGAPVRAVVVLRPENLEKFLEYIQGAMNPLRSEQADTFVVTINGRKGGGAFSDMVDDAIAEKRLRKSPEFFYLEPYMDGREAALTWTRSLDDYMSNTHMQTAFIAGWGLVRLLFSILMKGRRKSQPRRSYDPVAAYASGPADTPSAVPTQAPAQATSAAQSDNSFLLPQATQPEPVAAPQPVDHTVRNSYGEVDFVATARAKQEAMRQMREQQASKPRFGTGPIQSVEGANVGQIIQRVLTSPIAIKVGAFGVVCVIGTNLMGPAFLQVAGILVSFYFLYLMLTGKITKAISGMGKQIEELIS